MNNQGKNPQQLKDSENFLLSSIMGILILLLVMLLISCDVTYHLTDAEYDNAREEHLAVTYHNNSIYWGWNNGYYYYYGKPHYYPWTYYYNTCPPSYHNTTTHVVVNRPVNRPTHRPNINVRPNNNKVIIKNNHGSKRTNKTTIRRKPKK